MKSNLLKDNEDLMKEYDYEKNINIDLNKIAIGSGKKVWWICSICNESFKKSPCHIKNDVICNKCATSLGTKKKIETVIKNNGSFLDNYPELSKEWDYQKNCNINPSKVSKTSDKKVWWICPVGHSYNMTVGNRASGSGCPRCAKEMRISFPEKAFAYYLQKIDNSIIESYEPDFLKGKEIDIYIKNKNIGIEYDGRMWHKDKKKDILKNKLCKDNNIKDIKVDTTAIDNKNKYVDNYIYNAIVNYADYNNKKESKNISKIKENDIIQEIILKHYLNNKKQTRKDILKTYLSSSSPKQRFKHKQEIENAIRNINDEMEEAQKEFSKLFQNDNSYTK